MRFAKVILSILSLVILFQNSFAKGTSEEYLDSVYQQMSSFQKVSSLVLIKAEPNKTIPSENGIFIDYPLDKSILQDNRLLVVKLDARMNPLVPDQWDLPDLLTLSAITDQSVIQTYMNYFKKTCLQLGIDKVVLPENKYQSKPVDQTLEAFLRFDPKFFTTVEAYGIEPELNKKGIISAIDEYDFMVVKIRDLEEINDKLERHSKKILQKTDCESKIKEGLKMTASSVNLTYPERIPKQLSVAIVKSSLIPLQKQRGVFPLKSDSICLITDQPYGSFANALRNYTYVMTTALDISQSNAPIIIDGISKVDPELFNHDRQFIYIGARNTANSHLTYVDAALLYEQRNYNHNYTLPQQLFGAWSIAGQLPLGEIEGFENLSIKSNGVLGHAPPEMVGLDEVALMKIEAIMQEAIETGCTPGAQLAIAVDGSLVLSKAYGYLTYDSLIATDNATLYDLASLTKVMSTLLAVMKLYEDGTIDLDAPISTWLAEYGLSNKKDITIRALLSHNAGLRSYIPFWQKLISADRMETFYYQNEAAEIADIRSYGVRPSPSLKDTLQSWVLSSPLLSYDSLPFYRYSDIGFMMLHQIVERVSHQPFDEYLNVNFYEPMGLKRLTFNPLTRNFQRFEIAPTEYDDYFRDELIWGEVHDRNAAVFGGIAGHAGLFGNSGDLTAIMQMLLQGGNYGGQDYLRPETIAYFNRQFYPNNRRALGWDKNSETGGNASKLASPESFGHTGFTGTMVWADPVYNLAFVFLSNRVYPNSNNYRLINSDIRTRLQDVVYEALISKWKK
ncbi:MAG: CubicO group peptidase (beta-lactamase class C family) [Marinoscillum sp.]|jgi:CubicO group peptidase (beta-lactamase class C family)